MDKKTQQLRDIFMEVTEDETVTEPQAAARGSLSSTKADVEERLGSVLGAMREQYDFRTSLDDAALVTIVRGFYDGLSDAELADRLGDRAGRDAVRRARIDLHLLTDDDLDAPLDLGALSADLDGGRSIVDLAAAYGVSDSTIRRYRHVIDAREQRRIAGDRFRDEFERILEDRELGEQMTAGIRRTGLEDATEGLESNVSF